ncbi:MULTISPECIES: hypothetical protein [unclassified Meiothermus]|uniref:hypothetical protein n=1 Tax=unclassified Meiothermus TaxID=370471 RepID=UPI000D7C1281|nr:MULTISPECIES: hypothetical protein [unclassified Meiothermus]PZA06951.1 hypothetical protein DNA98_09760 [Meiothermus sp. Pnk-1]RYM38339.1 hypothetical protein EWH23_04845 [Meiothermus sp. PNK-Is4]
MRGGWFALAIFPSALAQGEGRGLGLVFQQASALLFTLALGFAAVGGLVYIFSSQGAANRRWAYLLWAVGALLAVWGWVGR